MCKNCEISTDDSWKHRERIRFHTGEYLQTPWHHMDFYFPFISSHYAHVSTKDRSKVAFTECADKGRRDIQTRMKPGRYLKRFFGDVLSEEQIRDWAAKFSAENEKIQLKLAWTPDEIEHVYLNGPNSCMSKSIYRYDSSVHPTRVYGYGDLAIAYLEPSADDITARALCWPERKIYARIYGDESRLEAELKREGYTKGSSDFSGARLIRIEEDGRLVCPYLDVDCGITDHGTHLTIGGNIGASNTNGFAEYECVRCSHCLGPCDESNTYEVEGDTWCEFCFDNYAATCECCERNVHEGSIIIVVEEDEEHRSVCRRCRRGHYTHCNGCNQDRPDSMFAGSYSDCDQCCEPEEEEEEEETTTDSQNEESQSVHYTWSDAT